MELTNEERINEDRASRLYSLRERIIKTFDVEEISESDVSYLLKDIFNPFKITDVYLLLNSVCPKYQELVIIRDVNEWSIKYDFEILPLISRFVEPTIVSFCILLIQLITNRNIVIELHYLDDKLLNEISGFNSDKFILKSLEFLSQQ